MRQGNFPNSLGWESRCGNIFILGDIFICFFSISFFFFRESPASVYSSLSDSPRNLHPFSSTSTSSIRHIHNFHHDHLLLQAHPDACSIWSVDVHGGEHVARDAVHRPPSPHVHAHQVNFHVHAHQENLILIWFWWYLTFPNRHQPDHAYLRHVPLYKVSNYNPFTLTVLLFERYQKEDLEFANHCVCQKAIWTCTYVAFCRCTCSLVSRRPPWSPSGSSSPPPPPSSSPSWSDKSTDTWLQ